MTNIVQFPGKPDLTKLTGRSREAALSVIVPRLKELQATAIPHIVSGQEVEFATVGNLTVMFHRNPSSTYFGISGAGRWLLTGYFKPPGAGRHCGGAIDVKRWKHRGTWEHLLFDVEKIRVSPKHVGALTEFSRNMLLQSSPDIEQLIATDFASVIAESVSVAIRPCTPPPKQKPAS